MTQLENIVHTLILGVYLTTSVLSYISIEQMKRSADPEVRFMSVIFWRFCTNWGFTVQALYYALIVLSHYLRRSEDTLKSGEKLRTLSDYMFTILVVPLGIGISLCFWIIYSRHRELILPSSVDEMFPSWMNHLFHTYNSILPALDMLLTRHKVPSWSLSTKVILAFFGCYFICMAETYMRYGRHLYIFMRSYSMMEVASCVAGGMFLAFVFHAAVRCISEWRWGPSIFEVSSVKKEVKVED